MSRHTRERWERGLGVVALVALVAGATPAPGEAQPAEATTGERVAAPVPAPGLAATAPRRAAVAATLDVASAYMFRGIYQEDRGFIAQPLADLAVTVMTGDGTLKSVVASLGSWSSVHSGPTSSWYERDLYAGATFTLGRWKPGALYTSYTSPNDRFGTVHELAFSLAYDDSASRVPLSPKVLVAFELYGQADGGAHEGTYLELSARPVFIVIDAAAPLSLAIPVKVGLSLRDYYEGVRGSDTFGYIDIGIVASVPLPFMSGGAWDLHGGVDVLFFGNALEALNGGTAVKPVAVLGLGVVF